MLHFLPIQTILSALCILTFFVVCFINYSFKKICEKFSCFSSSQQFFTLDARFSDSMLEDLKWISKMIVSLNSGLFLSYLFFSIAFWQIKLANFVIALLFFIMYFAIFQTAYWWSKLDALTLFYNRSIILSLPEILIATHLHLNPILYSTTNCIKHESAFQNFCCAWHTNFKFLECTM